MNLQINNIYYIIIALFCAMIFVGQLAAAKTEYPILMSLKRWFRLIFFATTITICLQPLLPDRPLWVLAIMAVLVYILADSLFYWLQITMLSLSDYELFGSYKEVENAWSSQPKHIRLKHDLESNGLKKSGSFKSLPLEEIEVMITTFDSPDAKMRLTMAFIPYANTALQSASITSIGEDGKVYITEASTMPFGLSYPQNYFIERHPLVGSPLSLLEIHKKRISATTAIPLPPPVEMINKQLDDCEKASYKNGLINLGNDIEEYGSLTSEGKYRVWIDTIKIYYLPFLIS